MYELFLLTALVEFFSRSPIHVRFLLSPESRVGTTNTPALHTVTFIVMTGKPLQGQDLAGH